MLIMIIIIKIIKIKIIRHITIIPYLKFALLCNPFSFRYLKAPRTAVPELPPTNIPSSLIILLAYKNDSSSSVFTQASISDRSNTLGKQLCPIPSIL